MVGIYRLLCAGLGLSLVLGGDGKKETQVPTQPERSKVPYSQTTGLAEIVSPKTATHYNTNQLARRALNLSKDLFPKISEPCWDVYSGAIYIGKDLNGTNRYAIVEAMTKYHLRRLEVSLYAGLDSELEAQINRYLLNGDYKSAAEALGKSDSLIEFWDGGADGLKNLGEIIKIGSTLIHPPELSKDELRWVNDAYGYLLQEKIIPALERELQIKIVKQRLEKIMQEIGRTDPSRKPEDVEKIRTLLETLDKFVY